MCYSGYCPYEGSMGDCNITFDDKINNKWKEKNMVPCLLEYPKELENEYWETYKEINHEIKDETKLPDGKTCGNCIHFERCNMLFMAREDWVNCDFYPIKFKEK